MNRFRTLPLLLLVLLVSLISQAQVKILFDATKAETAGNADWVIDADLFNLGYSSGPAVAGQGNEANPQRYATPDQGTVTQSTTGSYWKGGISSWGIDLVKQGYWVETLPYNGQITYGNSSNAQDLSNYKVFVVCEPNILFTAAEKTAMMQFVQNGGGLFMVSDHDQSDRNNDGYDSPYIWNDFMSSNGIQSNPFGFTFDYASFSQTTTNIPNLPSDPLLHGSIGNVTQAMWSSGTSITLSPGANASIVGVVYKTGSSFGNSNVMVCHATYGNGKVVGFGDSSPCDDGSGDPNDQLYDGWIADASGNHRTLILNATLWLAATSAVAPVATTLAASGVSGTSATLNGTVNPNSTATTYHFEYGTSTSYGTNTTTASAGSGSSAVAVNANISGLSAGSTYHFRVVAQNSAGTSNGADMTFAPGVAVVTTQAASSIGSTSATSGGNVTTDGGLAVTARGVCWGTAANPDITGNHTLDGSGLGTFVSQLTGLVVNTAYHVRAYATNSSGTYYGADLQFNTLAPTLSVTPPNQNVTAPAGNTAFNVASNSNWTAISNASWCTVTASGSNNGTITATYSENTSVAVRVATLQVTVAGLTPVTVTVTQAGAAIKLDVTPASQTVPMAAGSISYSVQSNTNWTCTSNASWCVVTPSGNGNGFITANYSQNNDGVTRACNITVMAGTLTQTVHLYQLPSYVGLPEAGECVPNIYPNPGSGAITIMLPCSPTPSADVTIYSSKGQLVKAIPAGIDKQIVVDLSGLPAGIYFVRTLAAGKTFYTRLVLL